MPVTFDVVGSSWPLRYTCGNCPFSSQPSTALFLLFKSLVPGSLVYNLFAWVLGLVAKAAQLTFYDVVAFIQPEMLADALDTLWDT